MARRGGGDHPGTKGLALGKIDTDVAVTGGRGLEAMHYYERWDVMGDWTTCAGEAEDWMNVQLA